MTHAIEGRSRSTHSYIDSFTLANLSTASSPATFSEKLILDVWSYSSATYCKTLEFCAFMSHEALKDKSGKFNGSDRSNDSAIEVF